MAGNDAPITIKEVLTLQSTKVTMESEKYICVRETSSLVIIDMSMPMQPMRIPITADSALMSPNSRILALKAQLPGTTRDHLQIVDIELKASVPQASLLDAIKSHQMPEPVIFWKWITPKMLGLVTHTSVYHWSIEDDSEPIKMFNRTANLANNQIINYCCDPAEKWFALIGTAPGPPKKPQLVKGNIQLFSVDQKRSQAIEAHAASFSSFKVAGNENPSTLLCFASKATNAGHVTSKLHVMELGAQPGKPGFAKKQVDMFFPPVYADDFPVGMQVSQKYHLIYVITNFSLLFVYDLETATAIYRNRICLESILITAEASGIGGFYAINSMGHVLLTTVNEATIVPFVSNKLNNSKLALSLAKRGNLPGADKLVVESFQKLFSQKKYKEAAEIAADSPQGILRTPETVFKFQSVLVQAGQIPPLLQYFTTLLTNGKLNAFESVELSRLVANQNQMNLLEEWLAEDKLECTEELGDLVKTFDNDLALKIYIKARALTKVAATCVERREFDKIVSYSKQVGCTLDYLFLLQTILKLDSQEAVKFALMMAQMEGGSPVDYNTIADLFVQRKLIRQVTAFLLEVLKPNLPEHGFLQTKVLEINLATYPSVADDILANEMFSHYDHPRIGQLCEEAGLFVRAVQVNPSNALLVIGQLLDDEHPEDTIKGLIHSVRSLLPVEPLLAECEKRNRLHLLTGFLEHLVSEGSQDVYVHNALGKIIIDSNNDQEHFLTVNPYYDSRVVGKYCEKRNPILAVVAYRRGQCDDELINVTNKNSLFELQARYVVERMDGDLWEKVLRHDNEYRRQLIDQVVSTILPEESKKNPKQVSSALKAFITADLPQELISLIVRLDYKRRTKRSSVIPLFS